MRVYVHRYIYIYMCMLWCLCIYIYMQHTYVKDGQLVLKMCLLIRSWPVYCLYEAKQTHGCLRSCHLGIVPKLLQDRSLYCDCDSDYSTSPFMHFLSLGAVTSANYHMSSRQRQGYLEPMGLSFYACLGLEPTWRTVGRVISPDRSGYLRCLDKRAEGSSKPSRPQYPQPPQYSLRLLQVPPTREPAACESLQFAVSFPTWCLVFAMSYDLLRPTKSEVNVDSHSHGVAGRSGLLVWIDLAAGNYA